MKFKGDAMAPKNDDIEEMLLSGTSLDDLIRMKIEAEFKDEIKKSKEQKAKQQKREYTKIRSPERITFFQKMRFTNFTTEILSSKPISTEFRQKHFSAFSTISGTKF